jgi:hypothetical protein
MLIVNGERAHMLVGFANYGVSIIFRTCHKAGSLVGAMSNFIPPTN